MQEKPKFSWQISLGNVLQIGSMIVGLTVGWMALESRSKQNEMRLDALDSTITSIQTQVLNGQNKTDARLGSLEQDRARADERFSNILALLSRIDTRLERIENRDQQ